MGSSSCLYARTTHPPPGQVTPLKTTTHVVKEGGVALEGHIVVLHLLHAALVSVRQRTTCDPSPGILY